jgi:hypothetical protein
MRIDVGYTMNFYEEETLPKGVKPCGRETGKNRGVWNQYQKYGFDKKHVFDCRRIRSVIIFYQFARVLENAVRS